MPGLSSDTKKLQLSKISYSRYLKDYVKADPATIAFYQSRTHGEWGVGIDAVSALDCWGFGMKGMQGLKLAPGVIARMGYTPSGYAATGGSATLHFPDGNATIARSASARRLGRPYDADARLQPWLRGLGKRDDRTWSPAVVPSRRPPQRAGPA